jgi:hypothetical protein
MDRLAGDGAARKPNMNHRHRVINGCDSHVIGLSF